MTFQFTHPGKGATGGSSYVPHHPAVSIHAPWEGCDVPWMRSPAPLHTFQFTHPGKGATEIDGRSFSVVLFQFTHPGKGATRCCSTSAS